MNIYIIMKYLIKYISTTINNNHKIKGRKLKKDKKLNDNKIDKTLNTLFFYFLIKVTKKDLTIGNNILNTIISQLADLPVLGKIIGQPFVPISKKSILSRMGRGKTAPYKTCIHITSGGAICQGYVLAENKSLFLEMIHKSDLFKKKKIHTILFYQFEEVTTKKRKYHK